MGQTASIMTQRTCLLEARCHAVGVAVHRVLFGGRVLGVPFSNARKADGQFCRWIVSSGDLQSGITFQPRSRRLQRVYMTAICSWSRVGKVGSDRGVCQFRYRSLNIQIARCVPLERLNASDHVKAELDAEIVVGINATSERERSKLVQHKLDGGARGQ